LEKIRDAGPYDLVKTSHHTSYNGLSAPVFANLKTAPVFVHSGGSNDSSHPSESAVEVLKAHRSEIEFARTDHNRLVTIEKTGGEVTPDIQEGSLNDFSLNGDGDARRRHAEIAATNERLAALAAGPAAPAGQEVEVTVRLPRVTTGVTVTIDVAPRLDRPAP
jgi:hypothetical protein